MRFNNDLIYEKDTVFTIEPDFYVPRLGSFRHSDTVVLTGQGSRQITGYPADPAYEELHAMRAEEREASTGSTTGATTGSGPNHEGPEGFAGSAG